MGLTEVIPWVGQWRLHVHPSVGQPLAAFDGDIIDHALAPIGATRATLPDWRRPIPA